MSFWAMCAHFPQPTKSFAHHSVPSQPTKLCQNAAIHPHKHRHEGHLQSECFVLAYYKNWGMTLVAHKKSTWNMIKQASVDPSHVLKFQVTTSQPSFRSTKLIKAAFFPPIDGNMKLLNPKEFHMISSASIPRNSLIFCLFGLCGSARKNDASVKHSGVFRFGKFLPGKQHGRF